MPNQVHYFFTLLTDYVVHAMMWRLEFSIFRSSEQGVNMARHKVLRATDEDTKRMKSGTAVQKRRTRELLLCITQVNNLFGAVRRYDHLSGKKQIQVREIGEEVIKECLDLLNDNLTMDFAEKVYILDKAVAFALVARCDVEELEHSLSEFLAYPPVEHRKKVKSLRRWIKKVRAKEGKKRMIRPT